MKKDKIIERLKAIKTESKDLQEALILELRKESSAYIKQYVVGNPYYSSSGKRWYFVKSPPKKEYSLYEHDISGGYLSDLDGRRIFRARSYEGFSSSGEHWSCGGSYCYTIQSAIDQADKYQLEQWPCKISISRLF